MPDLETVTLPLLAIIEHTHLPFVATPEFVDKLASSDVPDTALMSYGANKKFSYLQANIEGFQNQCRSLSDKVEEDTRVEK